MGRLILAAIVGGILLHAWEFSSWMITDIHDLDPHPRLKNEAAVVEALKGTERGVYYIPGSDSQDFDPDSDAYKDWLKRYEAGPRGMLLIDPAGGTPMPPATIIKGGVINLLMALVLALTLWLGGIASMFGRFVVSMGFGLFLILGADLKQQNWMGWTDAWTHGMITDHLIGSAVLGVAMALIVRPRGHVKSEYE